MTTESTVVGTFGTQITIIVPGRKTKKHTATVHISYGTSPFFPQNSTRIMMKKFEKKKELDLTYYIMKRKNGMLLKKKRNTKIKTFFV